ncbi:uncharacterized protein [Procambarus clarkii]|uniref:uncharacterized protein n=1 Tax=Procambarus clarkii TaxID=6728 RepID=UPI0037424774
MASLAVVLLLCVLASPVWGEAACDCGTFLSTDQWVQQVVILRSTLVDNCHAFITCRRACIEQFLEVTGGGNLSHQLDDGETVGQLFCRALNERGDPHLPAHLVHLYMSLCEGPWEYAEVSTREPLCCLDGQHSSCQAFPQGKMSTMPVLQHARVVVQAVYHTSNI